MNIIKQAKKDPRNKQLLQFIYDHQVKIKYVESKDEYWSARLDHDCTTAIIAYRRCKKPAASLAHELLHIIIQLQGYKRIELYTSPQIDTQLFNNLMVALDNELQHHKMYKQFIELKYTDKEFYNDLDSNTELYLRERVAEHHVMNTSLIKITPDFLSLIAKGGSMSQEIINELLERFYSIDNFKYEHQLKNIKSLIEEWANSSSFDTIEIHKKILLEIHPSPQCTWLGLDKNNQNLSDGYFVDQEFGFI